MRPLTRSTVINCSFPSWYSRLKKHSLRATTLDLPADFLAYLEADGVVIPSGSGLTIDDDNVPEDADGSDLEDGQHYSFPELDEQIRRIIDEYGGAVFPKLNWSSPQDAAWISADQTLKCRCPADIYLLLKASDFAAFDLAHAFDGCVDGETEPTRKPPIQLVLKKWYELPRSNEFRCFVRDGKLIGISARDTTYYSFIAQNRDLQMQLQQRILTFFAEVVSPNFPDTHYVFDVYFTRDFDRVYLVDFNPWAERTEPLLFDWEELDTMMTDLPAFRIITSETQASQSRPQYAFNRVPKDVTALASGQTVAEFAADWQKALADAVAVDDERPRSRSSDHKIGR